MLINSLIPDNQISVLANVKDELPFLISTTKSALHTEDEIVKKLETRKADVIKLAKLKNKFKATKARKSEVE